MLRQLLGMGAYDANLGITTSNFMNSAMDQFDEGNTLYPPSPMDAVLGSSMGGYISHQFAPDILAQTAAQQTLRGITESKAKQGLAMSPMDFVIAAGMQDTANQLRTMLALTGRGY
jgi:hypothetical protein